MPTLEPDVEAEANPAYTVSRPLPREGQIALTVGVPTSFTMPEEIGLVDMGGNQAPSLSNNLDQDESSGVQPPDGVQEELEVSGVLEQESSVTNDEQSDDRASTTIRILRFRSLSSKVYWITSVFKLPTSEALDQN